MSDQSPVGEMPGTDAGRSWLPLSVGLILFFTADARAGLRAPPDPARERNLIVVATVEEWHSDTYLGSEQHSLVLKVSETLKGSADPLQRLTVQWVPELPEGCDTDPCDMSGWTRPARPEVGARVIACLEYVSPERTIAWQEFVYSFSEQRRLEMVKQIQRAGAEH